MDDRKRIERKLQSSVHALVILHEAARVLGSTLELEEIGARLLEIMRRVSDLSTAALELQDEMGGLRTLCALGPEDVRHWASTNPEVQAARRDALEAKEYRLFRLTQPERDVTASVVLYLPLVVRDRVTGVLGVYGPAALAEKTTLNALVSLTAQAASALENARLHRELIERERRLRDLVGKMLVVQEEERRRVACDIHDGLTQMAVATHQHLQAFADDHYSDSLPHQRKMNQALELAGQTVEEARRVIAGLRPMALNDLGLATALQMWVDSLRDNGWKLDYEQTLGEERLPTEIETALYRVAQEMLTNVRKHAQTDRARITLGRFGEHVYLEVRDWGRGCPVVAPLKDEAQGERVGIRGMRERIGLLGGEFSIRSRPGEGACVVAKVPLPRQTLVREGLVSSPGTETSTARLLIADDHALVREGLQVMLASEPKLEVVGEAADGLEAFELCRSLHPDLVLMDVRMPKMDGLAATRAIRAEGCVTRILMLTTYENPDHLLEAVRAGASGYIIKDAAKHELVGAVRGALSGEHPLDQELAMQLLQSLAAGDERTAGYSSERGKPSKPFHEPLTTRELEVLQLLARGQTNRQISQELVVSAATVKVHVEHILEKLQVSDRTQAAVLASEAGLLGLRAGNPG